MALVGPNSIIESDFGSDGHGNFEAVLFRDGQLHHMWGAPGEGGVDWRPGQSLPSPASGPGSIIQSDFGGGRHKNFEVLLWVDNELWHWWHDNSDVTRPWQRGQRISATATGPGSIIQGDFGAGDHKNFEVVALEGTDLVHYFHDNTDVNNPWQRAQTITHNATGPGSIIQGYFGGSHKNFEVVVPEGNELVHYFHDNSDVDNAWQRGQTVSVAATGPGCITKSSFGPGGPGNYEVLVQELTKSVVHYWHHNVDTTLPWWRSQVLLGFREDLINSPDVQETIKVAQLTGEFDRQLRSPTLSRTASRFGVVGTDLGQSFEHDGRLVFLFGDTETDGNLRKDPGSAFDSIAFTNTMDPREGVLLDFDLTYPHVEGIDQQAFWDQH